MEECKYDHIGTDRALIERIEEINITSPIHGLREAKEVVKDIAQQLSELETRVKRNECHCRHQSTLNARFEREIAELRDK